MSFYQLGILGTPKSAERAVLVQSIQAMIEPFGLSIDAGVDVLAPDACLTRDPKSAFAAVYFGGGDDAESLKAVDALVHDNVPIIPVVDELKGFSTKVPPALQAANGMALGAAGTNLEALAAAILECLGLLRRQRRVFLSYRR